MDGGISMIIYPAIDLLDGKCVRLLQGDYDKVTVYSENPADFANIWVKKGAKFIHVVDLNGAKTGKSSNDSVIKNIVENIDVPVQVGGGIRSMSRIDELLSLGVKRIILGTVAVKNPDLVKDAVKKYGKSIAVGIDAKDDYVATDGWLNKSSYKAEEFAKEMVKIGVKTIIYTDIKRDGMLVGPNLKAMKSMAKAVSCDVIASGGVSSIADIEALSKTGVSGVITGKALYENKIDLQEANNLVYREV